VVDGESLREGRSIGRIGLFKIDLALGTPSPRLVCKIQKTMSLFCHYALDL
jgi:hypothetical protein